MNSPSEGKLAGESGVVSTNGQANSNCTLNNSSSINGGLMQDSSQVSANSNTAISPGDSRSNLIINYLPQSIKEHDFNMLFSKIGPLKSCKLMFDRQTGW